MSTNYTSENPRQSSSRGGRRRSRRGGSNRSGEGSSRSSSEGSSSRPRRSESSSRKPKELTLWEKIVAFFTGGKPAKATAPAARRSERTSSSEPRAERTERPERAPRTPRTGMRTPESVEVTTPRLYVGNLSFDATESDLHELFSGLGIVQTVEVVSNRQTQRSKGFGFVQMQTIDEAKRAVSELHDKEYMGRKLVVSGAKAADRREDREERSQQPEQ
jgi:hypothetical protein